MINDFKPNTIIEMQSALIAYLPDGRLFLAKNDINSNLRRLFNAISLEYGRLQNKIYEISVETDIDEANNLINEWERSVAIPDFCLNTKHDITLRRKQVKAKFALMNLTTEKDWIDLAFFFGLRITIDYGTTFDVFPMTFPIYFAGSAKAIKFTMIVNFYEIDKPKNIFTLTFPVTFEEDTNFIKCLFKKLKPANVNLVFRYKDDLK